MSLSSSSSSSSSAPNEPSSPVTLVLAADTPVSHTIPFPNETGVWQYFKQGEAKDADKNICHSFLSPSIQCKTKIQRHASGTTTNMKKHLERKHRITPTSRQSSASSSSSPTSTANTKAITSFMSKLQSTDTISTTRLPLTKIQKQQWNVMLLRMAVEMNVSFRSLCECEVFKQFMQ
jgi:hypothetical protein